MADAKDLFDKGKDVTDLFNKGTDVQQDVQEPYTKLGSAAMGAAQGATLGFDDEIAGAAKALIDKGVGDKRDFWDIYKTVRDGVRKEHEKAASDNPISNFAGNIVGGVAPMLIPGVGEALGGAKLAEGASIEAKIGQMATTGAKVGAIAGLGGSNADLTSGEPGQIGQAAKDTTKGAAMGAAVAPTIGGVMNGLGSAGKYIGKTISTLPLAQDASAVASETYAGNDLGAPGQVTETNNATRNTAKGVVEGLEAKRALEGTARQENLQDLTDQGAKLDNNDLVDKELARTEAEKKSAGTDKQADLERYQALLKSLVQQRTEENPSFIPDRSGAPKLTGEEAAQSAVAKQTAAAQTKTDMQINALIEDFKASTDTDEKTKILQKLTKLSDIKDSTELPMGTETEPLTGMETVGVQRGANANPIVKTVTPLSPMEPGPYTPIQRVTSPMTVRDRPSMTPVELGEFLKEIEAERQNMGPYGRQQTDALRSTLKGKLNSLGEAPVDTDGNPLPMDQDKADALDQFKKSIDDFNDNTENFKGVASTQDQLGTPGYSSNATPGKQVGTVDKLQSMIRSYDRPDSMARVKLDEALDNLAQTHPEDAQSIRDQITTASKNFRLSKALVAEGFQPGSHATLGTSMKAGTLQATRAAANVARTLGQGTKATSQQLIESANKVYQYTPEQIQNLAEFAINKGGNYGKIAAKTLNNLYNQPVSKQKAVLFTLMQQPDFRQLANDYMYGNDNDQSTP